MKQFPVILGLALFFYGVVLIFLDGFNPPPFTYVVMVIGALVFIGGIIASMVSTARSKRE